MSTESKARRLFELDSAVLRENEIKWSEVLFPNLGKSWEEVDDETKNVYYKAVANGDYDIEFEEEKND